MVSLDRTIRYRGVFIDELSSGVQKASAKSKRALDRGIKKPLQDSSKEATKFGRILKQALGAAVIIQGIRAITRLTKEMSEAAAAAEELESKFRIAFEEGERAADAFATSLAERVGRGTEDIRQSMADLQVILRSLDFPTNEAQAFSTVMAELAIDISSFRDVPMDQVFNAIRSGATGITVPLKTMGIAITDAEVKARALADGFVQIGATLDPTTRAVTTLNLLFEKTAQDQGDAARTIGSTTNQLRGLASQFATIRAEIGQGVNRELNNFIQEMGGAEQVARDLGIALSLVADIATTTFKVAGDVVGPFTEAISVAGLAWAELTENTALARRIEESLLDPRKELERFTKQATEARRNLQLLRNETFRQDPKTSLSLTPELRTQRIEEYRKQLEDANKAAENIRTNLEAQAAAAADTESAQEKLAAATRELVNAQRSSLEVQQKLVQQETGYADLLSFTENVRKKRTLTIREELADLDKWREQMRAAAERLREVERLLGPEDLRNHSAAVREIGLAYDEMRGKILSSSSAMRELGGILAKEFPEAARFALTSLQQFGAAAERSQRKAREVQKGLIEQTKEISENGRTLESGLVSAFGAITPAINQSTNALERFIATLAQAISQALIAKSIGAIIGSAFGGGGPRAPGTAFDGIAPVDPTGGGVGFPPVKSLAPPPPIGGTRGLSGPPPVSPSNIVLATAGARSVSGGSTSTNTTIVQEISIQALDSSSVRDLILSERGAVGDAFLERFLEDSTLRGTVQGRVT